MPHILRIDNDPNVSQQNHQDWTGSHNGLTGDRINHIPDTFSGAAGNVAGSAAKAGTSIPSPFARLYLFDTSFRMVNSDINARELTMYHILVSHCLDMLELLFQAGNSPDLTYKVWNREQRLNALNSKTAANGAGGVLTRHPHQILAKALDLDLRNELASLQQFTLIYYKGALLGGTSPLTLVFTSPNWEQERQNKYIDAPKSTTGRTFFQNEYVPLRQRDAGFVTYLRRLYDQYSGSMLRGGLKDYLYKVYFDGPVAPSVEPDTKLANFDPIQIGGDGNSTLQVVPGLALYKVREADVLADIEEGSDFVMQLNPGMKQYERESRNGAPTGVRRPLVLASQMDVTGRYVKNTNWNPQTVITRPLPHNLSEGGLLADRYLPGVDNVRYPFITTDDFLEPYLIKMPYKLNNGRFFTGIVGDFEFLLPVSKAYFNFFGMEDLKRQLTISVEGNTLTARLQIPIRNNRTVEFKKKYSLADEQTTLNFRARLAFFPFYKLTVPELQNLNQYTVMLADLSDETTNFRAASSVQFYQINQSIANYWKPLDVLTPEPRSTKANLNSPATYFYKVDRPFDLLEVRLERNGVPYHGLIMPQFTIIAQKGHNPFTFAIDFGTSNTHVAYTDTITGNIEPKPLTVSDNKVQLEQDELQMVTLNKPYDGKEEKNMYERYRLPVSYGSLPQFDSPIRREFIPAILGKEFGSPFSFPLRTTVFEKIGMGDGGDNLFSKINLGFNIDLEETPTGVNRYVTNLKWLFENQPGDTLNKPRVRAFFETLLLLIRNKVILNQGNVQETKVVWLAPSSMRESTKESLEEQWKKAFGRVFGTTKNFVEAPISESLAPYFYLRTQGVKAFADAINVDIGGGTSDLMLLMRGQERYLNTSFRFAGYDIWGGGLNEQGHPSHKKDNGFIKNYNIFKRSLSQPPVREGVFNNFLQDQDLTAEDIVSLLFKYDDDFKFGQSIKDGKPALRIVLYLHYSAIVYHLVQLIEAHKLGLPRYLTFTGRGSQYLNLLGSRSRLIEFTKLLFNAYTTLPVPNDFEVILTDNPKETTANGAVLYENSSVTEKERYKTVEGQPFWGNEPEKPVAFTYRRTKVSEMHTNQDFHDSVLRNVQHFLERTLKDPDIEYFLSQYNITTPEKYYNLLVGPDVTRGGRLYDSYKLAWMAMEQNPNEALSETFFFLPLKHSLYELSKHIAES